MGDTISSRFFEQILYKPDVLDVLISIFISRSM